MAASSRSVSLSSAADPQVGGAACGIGAVALAGGRVGRYPVEMALKALRRLEHRGGVMPDGVGDGAGLMVGMPSAFFERELSRLLADERRERPRAGEFAVGVFFLPRSADAAEACRRTAERVLRLVGLGVLVWRRVPICDRILPVRAREQLPRIEHLFVSLAHIDRRRRPQVLFRARKAIEEEFARAGLHQAYIASLSHLTVVYKGMLTSEDLPRFYPDLRAEDFETSLAVFHRRFSTNTFPDWRLAQPLRLIAHNGEINTILGNRRAVEWFEAYLRQHAAHLPWEGRLLGEGSSDSADFDAMLEAYTAEGRSLPYALAVLKPPAWEERQRSFSPEMRAFFEWHKRAMGNLGSWDGPAAVIACDGEIICAALDRMGLRPLRYALDREGNFYLTSEVGCFGLRAEDLRIRVQLAPGDLVVYRPADAAVATDVEVYQSVLEEARQHLGGSFQELNRSCLVRPSRFGLYERDELADLAALGGGLDRFLRAHGWESAERRRAVRYMLSEGKEPVGSMGFDRCLSCLSGEHPTLYQFFHQRFAEVTNPPVDPYREGGAMCLVTYLGAMPDVPPRVSRQWTNLRLRSPVVEDRTVEEVLNHERLRAVRLSLGYAADAGGGGLGEALWRLADEAVAAARDGAEVVVLSDKDVPAAGLLPMPPLLACGAVNRRLTAAGLRPLTSILVQAADVKESHDIACLLAVGASAVNPYALFAVVRAEAEHVGLPLPMAVKRTLAALDDGLIRIMSKMGITTIQGYRDSGLFEAVGLGEEVMACFPHVVSRLGGMNLDDVGEELSARVRKARDISSLPTVARDPSSYPPDLVRQMRRVARGEREAHRQFSRMVRRRRPVCLRDLFEVVPAGPPLPLEEVMSTEEILNLHLVAAAMSRGALSEVAHRTIARAANRLGMRSNSGEGGEDELRNPGGPLQHERSRIRQVASGRFGVDAVYLLGADEIQIKIAQGAKPGEGGQLLREKVTPEVARLRCCRPGIDLISPPPHHDIYSIEDLAQLIRDLRAVNPRARILVKLAATTGIGTIGVGVAKAGADLIEVDGYDGGTGASPRPSIEHAGLPVELGVKELHLALVENGLRRHVRLRAAGGIKGEEDILRLALLGAEEFALGSALLVALGCVRCGRCHTGRCPAGIAGERHSRARFVGSEEDLVRFLLQLAEGLRERLAGLGVRRLEEVVGRSDLLRQEGEEELRGRPGVGGELARHLRRLDLTYLLSTPTAPADDLPPPARSVPAGSLLRQMEADEDLRRAVEQARYVERRYQVTNSNSIDFAAPVVRWVAERFGRSGWQGKEGAEGGSHPRRNVLVRFITAGRGGQSFGAFLVEGIEIIHHGSVNDGVGKGMSGGRIVIRSTGRIAAELFENDLVGSNAAYGATGGVLYVEGAAGQRLAVRNSGARIVVEGTGKYPCEYMTGGVVVVLGPIGQVVGAGMTDGVIFVYDPDNTQDLQWKIHADSVQVEELGEEDLEGVLGPLLEDFVSATGSRRGREALSNLAAFWKVVPRWGPH